MARLNTILVSYVETMPHLFSLYFNLLHKNTLQRHIRYARLEFQQEMILEKVRKYLLQSQLRI